MAVAIMHIVTVAVGPVAVGADRFRLVSRSLVGWLVGRYRQVSGLTGIGLDSIGLGKTDLRQQGK